MDFKQDCINKKLIYENENLHSSSITLIASKNHKLKLITVKAGFKNHNI